MESGNLVRTDMELGHTQNEGVTLQMKQQPGTIVVYHPRYIEIHVYGIVAKKEEKEYQTPHT